MKNKKEQNVVYILAGYTPWSKDVFHNKIKNYPGKWYLFSKLPDLTEDNLKKIRPRYIFFLHWSWKIPQNIIERYKCICFHMTNVPYGRGGSPLQNLIIRGYKKTKLSALKMTKDFDAGPVYLKRTMLLNGTAEEIYRRASNLSADMILKIIQSRIKPSHQRGKPIVFKRRKSEESEIPECKYLQKLYDFIRMLDAEGYPRAFIKYKNFIFEFSQPILYHKDILCDVKIKKINEN